MPACRPYAGRTGTAKAFSRRAFDRRALAIAVVSAGIGARRRRRSSSATTPRQRRRRVVGRRQRPAANMPPGSVEQVASKVVPAS
ncbi:protease domain protein [Mycobacterium intracellulare MIN_061107_1834]|nr:protease domain protein [Mycobacterium intracellulare MIN_061107_1834]